MKAPITFAALLLAMAAVATPAMARDGRHGNDGDRGRHGHDRRDDDRDRGEWRDRDDRHDRHDRGRHDRDRRRGRVVYVPGWRQPAYRAPPPRVYYQKRRPPAYGYYRGHPHWTRGARYYDRGYGPTYVVNDYRYYGLRPPPYGYRWRRDDRGDFLLVAIATGIIVDLVLNGGY